MLPFLSAAPALLLNELPTRAPPRCETVHMDITDMEGVGPETANRVFDPLGLAEVSDDSLAWFRHAEIKHGRIAMAAFVGWLWVDMGGALFPGAYSLSGDTFESLGHDSFAAWEALPSYAKMQIILVLGAIEFASEAEKPHYMRGGTPGKVKVNGLPLAPLADALAKGNSEKRLSELKNGRLAMIGIASVYAAKAIPGSVPFIPP